MKQINSMFGSWCADCGADLMDGACVCPNLAANPHPSWRNPDSDLVRKLTDALEGRDVSVGIYGLRRPSAEKLARVAAEVVREHVTELEDRISQLLANYSFMEAFATKQLGPDSLELHNETILRWVVEACRQAQATDTEIEGLEGSIAT